ARGRQSERDIVREQHRTLFEYDETMQDFFGGDFEEYFSVIEHPEDLPLPQTDGLNGADIADMLSEPDIADEALSDEDFEVPFENDSLYRSASAWSERLHELGHLAYDHRARRDADVFRVTINALLVSGKIAYALDVDEEELERQDAEVRHAEYETSIRAYTLAAIFLQRVRESLGAVVNKKIAPMREWARLLSESDALASEIGKRVLDLRKRLHEPSH
ncbi:MAG: hypothetical protein Q8P78_02925, partial [bacterium]|nr:hypothetical protein [bacterium]